MRESGDNKFIIFLDKMIKYVLYGLVFLFPLFFLPLTLYPINASKIVFVSVFLFLSLFLYLLRIIVSGQLKLKWGKFSTVAFIFIIILLISVLFSKAKFQSFWGTNFEENAFFAFILYFLGFFLFSNLPKKREIIAILKAFLLSCGVLGIFFLTNIIFSPVLSWDFAGNGEFNPIGTVQSLALFLGAGLILSFLLQGRNKGWNIGKIILGIILFISLILINFWLSFLVLSLSLILIIWFRLNSNRENFNYKKVAIPVFVLIIFLIFLFIKIPIINFSPEANLTPKTSLNIARETLNSSSKNFLFGSGLATFPEQYELFRPQKINLTEFWSFRFRQGHSFVLTILTEAGILGFLALLGVVLIFLSKIIKILSRGGNGKLKILSILSFYFLFLWFFYSINFSLMFFSFLTLGLFSAVANKEKRMFFEKSPQLAFALMLFSIILIVGMGVGGYRSGRIYAAAIKFEEGVVLMNKENPKLNKGIEKINSAYNLNKKNDKYARNLSQSLLLKLKEIVADKDISQEEKSQMSQIFVNNIEKLSEKSVSLNPRNSQNWTQRSGVYESFLTLGIKKAGESALYNLEQAQNLAPFNPYIPYKEAKIYLILARRTENKNDFLGKIKKAETKAREAFNLKNNFTPAHKLLSEIEEIKNKK